jgi:hypothetical protein
MNIVQMGSEASIPLVNKPMDSMQRISCDDAGTNVSLHSICNALSVTQKLNSKIPFR